jgi:hypothetical protein
MLLPPTQPVPTPDESDYRVDSPGVWSHDYGLLIRVIQAVEYARRVSPPTNAMPPIITPLSKTPPITAPSKFIPNAAVGDAERLRAPEKIRPEKNTGNAAPKAAVNMFEAIGSPFNDEYGITIPKTIKIRMNHSRGQR